MITTINNPGALQPYKLKSLRGIASSSWSRLKEGDVITVFKFLITESINFLNKGKIKRKEGKYFCPVCGNHSGAFVHLSNRLRFSWNSACGHCSSRARHRGLFNVYKEATEEMTNENSVLHFAPEPAFYSILKGKAFKYITTDFVLEDVDLPKEDIQKLTLPDNSYDLILCNHVLEHVPDDKKSLMELYRILKPGGKLLLTIPGNYKRSRTIYFSHLNHNGHYRDYGSDFVQLFSSIFQDYEVADLHNKQHKLNLAIRKYEWLFIGTKLK
jgi:SAM-dependent methyltransferase